MISPYLVEFLLLFLASRSYVDFPPVSTLSLLDENVEFLIRGSIFLTQYRCRMFSLLLNVFIE